MQHMPVSLQQASYYTGMLYVLATGKYLQNLLPSDCVLLLCVPLFRSQVTNTHTHTHTHTHIHTHIHTHAHTHRKRGTAVHVPARGQRRPQNYGPRGLKSEATCGPQFGTLNDASAGQRQRRSIEEYF